MSDAVFAEKKVRKIPELHCFANLPRKTLPYHADEPLPTATSPAIMALGAMKAACAEFGAAFATATAVVEGKAVCKKGNDKRLSFQIESIETHGA